MHGVGELETTLFKQHHQRYRGDRFGHGVNSEDGVVTQRCSAFQVHQASGAGMGDNAVSHHVNRVARYFLACQVVVL